MNHNEGGQLGFAVLLFQDMAVIPILAVILYLLAKQPVVIGIVLP